MKTVLEFQEAKIQNRPISMVTAYDSWSARLVQESPIDAILVGDSVAMVVHGFETTLNATVEMMALHTAAVRRGAPDKFVVGDLPFMSTHKSVDKGLEAVETLVRAGAQAVKLEGLDGQKDLIKQIVRSGIPVMGHLGLTPQFVHQFGGFKLQGKTDEAAQRILEQAKKLEDLGCFALVLECIPTILGETITNELQIPTIGIGAGPYCSGQILVLQDLLTLTSGPKPRFVRPFMNGAEQIQNALSAYHSAVTEKVFPSAPESYQWPKS